MKEGNQEVFDVLSGINVNDNTKKKSNKTYLSWAWAWSEVKKAYPCATYKIYRDENDKPYVFDSDLGYMCMTTVTIKSETLEMWLPVMDGANNAMKNEGYTYPVIEWKNGQKTGGFIDKKVAKASMFDINKTIMRCLVKNLAMFGLGIYIYAGEDLPEDEKSEMDKRRGLLKTELTTDEINIVSLKIKASANKVVLQSLYAEDARYKTNRDVASLFNERLEELKEKQ